MYRICLIMITLAVIMTAMSSSIEIFGPKNAHAVNASKIDFVMTVKNIAHDNVTVSLTVDGISQNITLNGNPDFVVAPTSQIVKFSFPRENNQTNQAPIVLKMGDEYIVCESFKDSEASCLSGKIDSLTIPQAKNLDVKYIPSEG